MSFLERVATWLIICDRQWRSVDLRDPDAFLDGLTLPRSWFSYILDRKETRRQVYRFTAMLVESLGTYLRLILDSLISNVERSLVASRM